MLCRSESTEDRGRSSSPWRNACCREDVRDVVVHEASDLNEVRFTDLGILDEFPIPIEKIHDKAGTSLRPTVGDLVALQETHNTRQRFLDGIGKSFIICADHNNPNSEWPPYMIEGYTDHLFEEDVEFIRHIVEEDDMVAVRSRIASEGKISLAPGLQGQVMKTDGSGALIKFEESGVQWDHSVSKENLRKLQLSSRESVKRPGMQKGVQIRLDGTIREEGKTTLVPGLRGEVTEIDTTGALIRFSESGVQWDHYVKKDFFPALVSI